MSKYLTYSKDLLDFSASAQSSAVIALKLFAYCTNQTSANSHSYKGHKNRLPDQLPRGQRRYVGVVLTLPKYLVYSQEAIK